MEQDKSASQKIKEAHFQDDQTGLEDETEGNGPISPEKSQVAKKKFGQGIANWINKGKTNLVAK